MYEAKKYGRATEDDLQKPVELMEQAPVISNNRNDAGEGDDVPSDDAATNPVSDEEDPTDEEQPDVPANTDAPVTFVSPMSVLSEQTAPETTSPPRVLEKQEGEEAQVEPSKTTAASGLLCGCI